MAKPSDYGIDYFTEERLKTRDHVRLHTYVMMISENPEEIIEAPTILYFHASSCSYYYYYYYRYLFSWNLKIILFYLYRLMLVIW